MSSSSEVLVSPAELQAMAEEVREARAEMARVRSVLGDAVRRISEGFQGLHAETMHHQELLSSTLALLGGDGSASGMRFQRFTEETQETLQLFRGILDRGRSGFGYDNAVWRFAVFGDCEVRGKGVGGCEE